MDVELFMDVELIMDMWPVIIHACCRPGGRRHCQFHGRGARHGRGACHGRGARHGHGARHGCGARQIKIDQRINVLYYFRIHK